MHAWPPIVRSAAVFDSIRAPGSRRAATIVFLGIVTLAACVGRPGTLPSKEDVFASVTTGTPELRGSNMRLTATDLARTQASSTLDAVRRSRPDFLRTSDRAAMVERSTPPSVYLDGHFVGGLEALNTVHLNVVREIVFMHPSEARERLGSRCECGG